MAARGLGVGLLMVAVTVGCKELGRVHTGPSEPPPVVEEQPPPPNTPGPSDAGGADGGDGDAGAPPGADGGQVPDAGPPVKPPPTLPSLDGWQFFGPQHGGPREVWSVSSDAAGNLWVAGGLEGLYLLEPGATQFRRFTHLDGLTPFDDGTGAQLQKVISVGGGPANTVYVGYEGHFGTLGLSDPPHLLKSGDADRVVWNGATLSVTHLDLSTGPGVSEFYPDGRDLIRSVHRILYHRPTGDVWFGGNHGVAMWHATERRLIEHQHAAINGYTEAGVYTMLSGDWFGVGVDPAGDLWFGGGHRVARLQFGAHRSFWAPIEPIIDVWPDAQPDDAQPEMRTDDFIQDMAVGGGAIFVGSIPNGLARIAADGTVSYLDRNQLVEPKVTALEWDTSDGSLWVGHIWSGLTRIRSGSYHIISEELGELVQGDIPDIQSDTFQGRRRILVAFKSGAVGIYTGP